MHQFSPAVQKARWHEGMLSSHATKSDISIGFKLYFLECLSPPKVTPDIGSGPGEFSFEAGVVKASEGVAC